ncbi:uncharacterized protein LOC143583650 [Bidens hawaiensis]|uniref:uncharacterized protein LOC143583650 n=1 Tax=Bidens hawaiensis TaxID=980011 RepID=UPI00404AE6E2
MAMIVRRVKRFMKKTGRKFVGERPGFDKSKVRCYNCQQNGHFARECTNERVERSQNRPTQQNGSGNEIKAMVSQQNGGYNWNIQVEEVIEQANLVKIETGRCEREPVEDQAYMAEVNDQPAVNDQLSKEQSSRAVNNMWVVDSGCSRHMTGNKKLLRDWKSVQGGRVSFEGESRGRITGI